MRAETAPAPAPSRANPWLIGAVVALSIALIAAVTWAFAERSANDTSTAMPSDAVVVQAVYDSVDAWTNGDSTAIRQVYAPDAVFVDMIGDTTYNGADEIATVATSATGSDPGWLQMTSLVIVRDGTAAYGFRIGGPENGGIALVEVNAVGQIMYQVVRALAAEPVSPLARAARRPAGSAGHPHAGSPG